MTTSRPAPIRRDWISKTLAGSLLGFTLAMGCSGLFMLLPPALPLPVKAQLAMWLVAPIWMGVFGGVYAFASGARAWLWLGSANLIILGTLAIARLL